MIPVTAIVVTRNEADNIAHCLLPLVGLFTRVIVVDSGSTDDTAETAKSLGAEVIQFRWNGAYPKKRQWCLENIYGLGDWVFFIDADETPSHELLREMRVLFARGPKADGYFIRGRYVWQNTRLRFGLTNNKLCLFKKSAFAYPPVNDLDIDGMGEIEGHYQPVPAREGVRLGQLDNAVIHHNRKGRGDWMRRHERYAVWEAGMILRDAYPPDPIAWRQELKVATRAAWFRPYLVFAYSYIFKLGFLDGVAGFDFALARASYARAVLNRLRSAQ
ncbi:MAG: glycosyltransferase family 2 protein [Alphaproteobacteria bacterium]|nr:glycosyltransferase family 2 protein [Alphaproteobacteria bacterium]